MNGVDARRGVAQLFAGRGDFCEHGLQNEVAASLGLLQRTAENLGGQALGLVVHLKCGDAFLGARDLEVHVAQEVFHTLDVGQDRHLARTVFFHTFDETHSDTSYRSLDRNTCIHQCQAASAYGRLRRRTVGG